MCVEKGRKAPQGREEVGEATNGRNEGAGGEDATNGHRETNNGRVLLLGGPSPPSFLGGLLASPHFHPSIVGWYPLLLSCPP